MNPRYVRFVLTAVTLLLLICPVQAADIGTAFSYQGFLEKPAGTPVTDTCDFRFGLWDALTGGSEKGASPQSIPAVDVVGGAFTVSFLDFGPSAIDGTARWLAIEIKCPGDPDFILLDPRVELTPAPYSLRAGQGVGGPNALNVTANGDVGIGTTAPIALLDVNGSTRTTTLEITGGAPFVAPLAGWGYNGDGQIDVPFDTVTSVAAGYNHGAAIRTDGTLVEWGHYNGDAPAGTFTAVSAGIGFSLAIRTDGTLVGWGDNSYGQIEVPAGTFTSVAAGGYHSLALRTDGTLAGWGYNEMGESSPPAGTFVAIAAGRSHSLGIRDDGTLTGWGRNNEGQANVPSGTFVAIAGGYFHSLAIRTDGTLAGWGDNPMGETSVPLGTFTAVAAGYGHGVAIRTDGTLAGWGNNAYGQVDVPAGTFAAVAAGQYHNLAIRSDPPDPDPALRLFTDSAFKPGSNTWTIYSDRRLKKNIQPLSGALDRLMQLRGVTFQWLDPSAQGGTTGTQMGLIADEVQRAFPEWIGRDPKGYQTLTIGGFEALTAEALRELRQEKDEAIRKLEHENAALREALDRLSARLDAMEGTRRTDVHGMPK